MAPFVVTEAICDKAVVSDLGRTVIFGCFLYHFAGGERFVNLIVWWWRIRRFDLESFLVRFVHSLDKVFL